MAIILDADVIIRGEKGMFDLQRWVASRHFARVKGLTVIDPKL
jgi:hypothetical protein